MKPALILIGIPGLMYLAQAVFGYVPQGRYGMALCFVGYACANVGLILDAYGF